MVGVGTHLSSSGGVELAELTVAFKDRKVSWLSNLYSHDNVERNGAEELRWFDQYSSSVPLKMLTLFNNMR